MKNSLLELFFPRFCVGCGYIGVYVCKQCEGNLVRVKKNSCYYCEQPSFLGLTHPRCRRDRGIDGHLSVYLYTNLFKKLLHESKYKGSFIVLKSLISLLGREAFEDVGAWKRLFNPLITHVPLHENRLKQRGFNQAEIIAERYSYMNEIQSTNCLFRVLDTPHLANIKDMQERKKQIKNAFIFTGHSVPQSVIVVDDVVTTGATVLECAKVLKKEGVQTVLTISLAKG